MGGEFCLQVYTHSLLPVSQTSQRETTEENKKEEWDKDSLQLNTCHDNFDGTQGYLLTTNTVHNCRPMHYNQQASKQGVGCAHAAVGVSFNLSQVIKVRWSCHTKQSQTNRHSQVMLMNEVREEEHLTVVLMPSGPLHAIDSLAASWVHLDCTSCLTSLWGSPPLFWSHQCNTLSSCPSEHCLKLTAPEHEGRHRHVDDSISWPSPNETQRREWEKEEGLRDKK